MNWLLAVVAATGLLAGPVVAGVVAPGLMTQAAERGIAVNHRHFVFDESLAVRDGDAAYVVHLADGDLYELPLSTQAVLRGSIAPAPPDEELREAFQHALRKYRMPVLSYEVQREGEGVVVKATLPAGLLANLSPEYRALLERYQEP